MGVFIDIREKFGFILVAIIALAIIAFLFMDVGSNTNYASTGDENTVGVVDGQKINYDAYNKKVQFNNQAYKVQNRQSPDANTSHDLNNDAWNQVVLEVLLKPQYTYLGVTVTENELYDMFLGERPDKIVVSNFTDPETGQFNKLAVKNMLDNFDQYDEQTKNQFSMFERSIKENRFVNKYVDLISKAIYYPKALAKFDNNLKNTTVDFSYTYLPFSNVSDEEVSVTDEDLEDYISNNSANFKQEPTRTIKYVTFEVLPTEEDSLAALKKIQDNLQKFQSIDDDSIFIKMYSDKPYDYRYKRTAQLPYAFTDTFFTVDTGTIIGPVLSEGAYVAIKLLDRKLIPDSVKLKHILLVPTSQEQVQGKRDLADTLIQLINEGSDFTALAIEYSEDEETKFTGGDLGWVNSGSTLPIQILDLALYFKNQGDVFVVGTQQGFHVVKVVASAPVTEAVKLAVFNRDIVALGKTDKAVYTEASSFLTSNRSAEAFNASEGEYALITADNLKASDNVIPNLGTSRELVAWAFNADIGKVSSIKSVDNKYVIALLTEVISEVPPLVKIRGEVEAIVKKNKKAELLFAKINQGQSLSEVASANSTTINTATAITSGTAYLDLVLGSEPGVIDKAITLTNGEKAIVIGNNGVYYIELTSKTVPTEISNYDATKDELANPLRRFAYNYVPQSLIEAVDVEDQRYKRFRD